MAAIDVNRLLAGYRDAELRLADAASKYDLSRMNVLNKLLAAGMGQGDAEILFESYERMFDPTFGASGSRMPGNDVARRLHDACTRAGVPKEEWDVFVGALKDARQAEMRSNAWSTQLYSIGGQGSLVAAREEVGDLLALRKDVIALAKTMAPHMSVQARHNLVEDGSASGPARFDPLRRLVAVSLDMTSFDARKEAYQQLWSAVEPMLGDKERAILQEQACGPRPDLLSPEERNRKVAEAFAKWVSPDRDRVKGSEKFFKPIGDFFTRVANAAQGRGYQNPEDVFKRAREGQVARRADRESIGGFRVPDQAKDPDGYQRGSEAIRALTDHQLAKRIRDQEKALDAAKKVRGNTLNNLIAYNPAVRGFKRVVTYFGKEGRDALRVDDDRMRELARGLAVMKAEKRARDDQRTGEAAKSLSPDPGPQPGQTAERPATMAGLVANDIGRQLGEAASAAYDGRHGTYTVNTAAGMAPDGTEMGLKVGLRNGNANVDLGMARDAAAAGVMIDAFERVVGEGRSSMQARTLAQYANLAGLQDIATIRGSGLIDDRLDQLIGSRDAYAFAYPLKTGDVIFQGSDQRWRAATMAEFAAYALTQGDKHLQAAAEVIQLDERMARARAGTDRTRDGQPGAEQARPSSQERAAETGAPGAPKPEAPDTERASGPDGDPRPSGGAASPQTAKPVAEPAVAKERGLPEEAQGPGAAIREVAMAARVAATAPLRLDPAASPESRRDQVRHFDEDGLRKTHAATVTAIKGVEERLAQAAKDKTMRSPADVQEKLELNAGRTALEKEFVQRGIAIPETVGKTKSRSRGRDSER